MQAHIDRLQAMTTRLYADLARAERREAQVQGEMRDWAQEMEQRIAEARSESDALRAEVEAVYQSSSWRITAPLRRLSLLLGRYRA